MVAPETDSAATVRVEVQGPGEMAEAETDFLAWTLAKESLLLQRFAVNLINANNAAYEIPVLLI
jgi:hypothetical protein